MTTKHEVVIVLASEFAPKLNELTLSGHVWAVQTTVTEEAARRIWEKHPPQETDTLTSGLALFKGVGNPEDDLLSILDEVELHHGMAGGRIPPMILRVFGAELTVTVREAFSSLGFTCFTPSSGGFIAQ